MPATSPSRTRPPVKQAHAVEALRKRIVTGALAPGAQLPVRSDLAEQLGVSGVTLQRAMDQLADEGFIVAHGTRGTYVADHPPHLSRIAITLPHLTSDPRSKRGIWTALVEQAQRLEHEYGHGVQLPIYEGVLEPDQRAILEADVAAHRVAGVIFAHPPSSLPNDSPIVTQPRLPRVSLTTHSHLGVPAIRADYISLLRRAAEHLASSGCKRVAILHASGLMRQRSDLLTTWKQIVAECNLQSGPWWQLGIDLNHASDAENLAQLLMHAPPDQRPDGLIVADDNLVEHTLVGLTAANVDLLHDITVVAHCNFPRATAAGWPITRLGFDVGQLLTAAIDSIQAQQRGQKTPSVSYLAAQFESELREADASSTPAAGPDYFAPPPQPDA